MRHFLAALILALGLAGLPAFAQSQSPLYHIEKEKIENNGRSEDRMFVSRRPDRNGKSTLFVTVQFRILDADNQPALDVQPAEIVVKEDGRKVSDLEIHAPTALEPLTIVLAIDTSGSMADHGKMDEAKRAARSFLDRLDPKSPCGLILFDHKLRVQEPPTGDRERLRRLIAGAQPGGGTAFLDATAEAIHMLRAIPGRRAIVVLTDGVDLNSAHTISEVVRQAREAEVPVYTIGVGEPGKNEPVTTVLVLDCSGSMKEPADESDEVTKIDALHRAAARFVEIMRPGSQTTLLPFSEEPKRPKPFSADKPALKRDIRQLFPGGETALFDATYDAIQCLEAARLQGKRAVIVMTDGKDNASNRRPEEVIREAREAKIPLHMLGLGRDDELDEIVMRVMAKQTGGTYQHAKSSQKLYEIFENLSIQLHDDGVDEAALRDLASETGGKYFPARDISKLRLIYEGLADELQNTYTVTFPSLQQDYDGTSRAIDITVWRGGLQVSDVLRGGYNVQGVVVPEMDPQVYLGLLLMLGGLLILPVGIRRLARRAV
jgi:VWFA-related protein